MVGCVKQKDREEGTDIHLSLSLFCFANFVFCFFIFFLRGKGEERPKSKVLGKLTKEDTNQNLESKSNGN